MAASNGHPHVPPQNLEAEEAVLGGMMVSAVSFDPVFAEIRLEPEDFYRERHRIVFRAIRELYERDEAVDSLTVTELLVQQGKLEEAGGKEEVWALASTTPAPGNAVHYARIVKENALLRRLLEAGQQIQQSVHSRQGEPQDLVESAERLLFEVAHAEHTSDFEPLNEVISREVDRLDKLASGELKTTGTPSGFFDLDALTGGFQPGNLIVVAARPAMGKCLAGGSLVYDPRSGEQRRMDEVVAAFEQGEEVWVASLGADLRIRPARVSNAFRNGAKRTFKLRTRLGRDIVATANHPLLTLRGWRELAELEPGMRIAVPCRLPAPVAGAEAASPVEDRSSLDLGVYNPQNPSRDAVGLRSTALTCDVSWDAVASIDPSGTQETYDLTVPGPHNFVADGLVVHNSGLVLNIADHVARELGRPVAFFSLEMAQMELAQRLIAFRSRVPSDKLRKAQVKSEWPRVLEAGNAYEDAPLWIDDSSDLGLLDLRAKARRLHARESANGHDGLGLIIIDYIQLMRPSDQRASRVEQVSQISRGLKILARELNVPVIGLSQLSRAPEQRQGDSKRPILSDLRESGQIEADSDVVAFIYRDEYYNPDSEDKGIAEILVRKNRNGPVGKVELVFREQYASFMNLSKRDRPAVRHPGEEPLSTDVDVAEEF